MCGSMADIQSAAAEIRRGKKKRRKKNKPQHENIMVSLLHRATINKQLSELYQLKHFAIEKFKNGTCQIYVIYVMSDLCNSCQK